MRRWCRAWVLGVVLSGVGPLGAARAEEPSAQILAKRVRAQGVLSLVGLTARLELVTTRPRSEERRQELQVSAKEIQGRVHTLTRFMAPAGVAGVALLSVEGPQGGAEQISLYLPKLKRVRKVARAQRGQTFMDTELSYADLGDPEASGKLTRLADGELLGRPTFVLEAEAGKDAPYGRVRIHLDQKTSAPLRVEYADPSGTPLKRFEVRALQTVEGRVLPKEASMENLQNGGRTTLQVLEVQRSSLGDDAFTERALERG